MNGDVVFQQRGWDDYIHWQTQDKRTLKRVNLLIQDILRNGNEGVGKPEALTGNLAGFWSRRIDGANRLVYRIREGRVEIIQCRTHYGD